MAGTGMAGRKYIVMGLAAAAGTLIVQFVALAFLVGAPDGGKAVALAIPGLFALLALGGSAYAIVKQWRRLDRLRGQVLIAAGNHGVLPPAEHVPGDEIDRLHLAIAVLQGRQQERRSLADRRVEAILGAIPDGIVVVTADGLISLLNAAGRSLFGSVALRQGALLGTSIYDIFPVAQLTAAIAKARAAGIPIETQLDHAGTGPLALTLAALGGDGGALLRIPAASMAAPALEADLDLHDRPPPPPPLGDDLALAVLPALALDTETTGLDIRRDRIISLAAFRLVGGQLYRNRPFDVIVNPGRGIPAASTAIHGITNALVAEAPAFASLAPDIAGLLSGLVLIGHHIRFDLALLKREFSLAGMTWAEPRALDIMLLYAALRPEAARFDLELIAADLGLPVIGRHTAYGDALLAAEIFVRLLPELAAQGVHKLGDAERLSAETLARLKRQRRATSRPGWPYGKGR